MKELRNPYSLLNYDMDDMENEKSTPEFERATSFIDGVLKEMVDEIKSQPFPIRLASLSGDMSAIGYCFYCKIGPSFDPGFSTGDSRIDGLIETAVKKLWEFANGPEDDGGMLDTMSRECMAYEVDRLMKSKRNAVDAASFVALSGVVKTM